MGLTDPTDIKTRDTFGRPITLNVANRADLASHYDYSPERYRLFVNGTRQQIQYDGEPTEFDDTADSFTLKPQNDGDVVTLETAEVYRYAVQYVIEWSIAYQANQSLQSGDAIIIGYGDADLVNSSDDTPGPSADGYFIEHNASLIDTQCKLSQYRDGTEQTAKTVDLQNAVTEWTRRAAETSWYSVGASVFHETITNNGTQENPVIGRLSADGIKGPTQGNHPLTASVKVGSSGAASLTCDVGSIGVRNFGSVDPILRRKTDAFTATISTTGSWVPIYAIRIDPDRRLVNAQFTAVRVPEFGGNGDVTVVPFSFDSDKLADSGGNAIVDSDFSTPTLHSETGSVIETSTNVAQFPDSGGTVGTSANNPGGYQEGYAANYTASGGSKNQPSEQAAKRTISERDVIVFLANADATGDVTVEYVTEQQW